MVVMLNFSGQRGDTTSGGYLINKDSSYVRQFRDQPCKSFVLFKIIDEFLVGIYLRHFTTLYLS